MLIRSMKNRIFLDSKYIILFDNKFDERKMRIINIKNIKKKLVKKIMGTIINKKYFLKINEKHMRTIRNIKILK